MGRRYDHFVAAAFLLCFFATHPSYMWALPSARGFCRSMFVSSLELGSHSFIGGAHFAFRSFVFAGFFEPCCVVLSPRTIYVASLCVLFAYICSISIDVLLTIHSSLRRVVSVLAA